MSRRASRPASTVTIRSRCALLTIAVYGHRCLHTYATCSIIFFVARGARGWCHRVQIDYDSGEPVYLQIARLLRDQIIQGELQVAQAQVNHTPAPGETATSPTSTVPAP